MKIKILIILIIILDSYFVFSQVPQGIPYQAVARNAQGQPLSNRTIKVRFSILDSTATGAAVYVESHAATTSSLGLFALNVGMGVATNGSFGAINWGVNYKFLKVELDTTASGNSYIELGTQQMMSVPYALYASKSESIINDINTYKHKIGEYFGGGIIFYLYKDSSNQEHGLIVSLNNVSNGHPYAYNNNQSTFLIGPSAQSSWNGLANSLAIESANGIVYSAARLCLDLTVDGQSDWYLPAIDELHLMQNSKYFINKSLENITGATFLETNRSYWSSTELNSTNAAYITFDPIVLYNYGKSAYIAVRPIRSF